MNHTSLGWRVNDLCFFAAQASSVGALKTALEDLLFVVLIRQRGCPDKGLVVMECDLVIRVCANTVIGL